MVESLLCEKLSREPVMIPDITYLILNYNPFGDGIAQDVLGATIDSFYARKSRKIACEVFLLDQGTNAAHRQWLIEKQNKYNFSTMLLDGNIGISGAINRVARFSRSPVVALITSDVIVTTGMDEDLFEKVQIPDVYQATPFTDKSDVDYQVWHPQEEFGSDNLDLEPLKKKGKSFLGKLFANECATYLRCIGCELNVMFWRRSVFDKIGYFDERWRACYENNDFSLRCFLAGGCTAISRDSFVWHHHKMTEKSKARDQVYRNQDWQQRITDEWNRKWCQVNREIDIYKLLRGKTINDFGELYEKYKKNIYLGYDQIPCSW